MKDFIWLIRKTLISTFKSYKGWLLYIAFPVAAITLAMLIQGGNSDAASLSIGVVNHDGEQVVAQDTIAFMERLDSVQITLVEETDVNGLIASGELDAALMIPAGFADSVRSGQPDTVKMVSIQGAAVTGSMKSYLNPYIDNIAQIGIAAAGDEEAFASLYAAYRETSFRLSPEKVQDRSVDYGVARRTVGYLVVIMLFCAATLSGIMLKEREERTYHRIIASAVAPRTYVLANIAVNFLVMLLQIALTLLIMSQVLHIEPGISYTMLFMLLALFALVAISLSLVIVAFSSSSQAASSLQNIIYLPTSLLAGCMVPIDALPAVLQHIAGFLPQYWLLETFGQLQLGSPSGSLLPNVLILAAFAAALALIAAYKVGRNDDVSRFV